MLTLHVAEASPETAVLVDGAHVAAVGPYEELAAANPDARLRRWPGILTPGLLNPYGPELLEQTYHPDPREAEEFGTAPIGGERARAIFRADPSRLGPSARRGVQRLLA
ncbi:imidazolonepropionase-like domain-containing protein, partial [Streptomyces sp.]|uniref:imidazolonepropionase-like domain-containing protein n=1 Tax=Streptomyces sp. TaxID=1931 RepID=UPI002FB0EACC